LLGNMIGLGNLMGFLASETGASVGALTIVSTHAQVDCPGTRPALKALHQSCVAAMNATANEGSLSGYEETVSV